MMARRPRGRRAIALIRVSKVGGREELLSPELQRTAIADYAEARGFEVVQWVEALDESGSQRRSPWWRRLDQAVEKIEAGDADAVLVWRFSRAARWRKAWAVALDRIESVGGVLESATEQLDTSTSTGRLARGMLAEMAAWESEVKGEQWKEVHANRLERGLPATGKPRFGYTYNRASGFTPDPQTAPYVKALYERFIQGDTHTQLSRWLATEGVRTTRGNFYTQQNLATYMDSGFAAGQLVTKDGTWPGAHEPLISAATWAHYQRVRETTRRQAPWTRQPAHPLGGLILCGTCHGPACRITLPRKNAAGETVRRYRYRCCQQTIGAEACSGPGMEQHLALEAVRAWLVDFATDVDARTSALAAKRVKAAEVKASARRLSAELQRLDEALARLAVQAALLPDAAYAMAREDLTGQREAAAQRLAMAQENADALTAPAATVVRTLLGSWDEWVAEDPKGLRDALATVIARCEIQPGESSRRSRLVIVPRWQD